MRGFEVDALMIVFLLAPLLQDVLPEGPVNQEWIIRALAGALIAVCIYWARREERRGDALATDNRELIVTVTKQTLIIDDIGDRVRSIEGKLDGLRQRGER